MSTSSTTIFSGNSRYAQDFTAVISRAVAIASLPITQLNNEKTNLTAQQAELQTMNSRVSALETAIQGVESALGGASFEAVVSDDSKLAATVSDGAAEGVYTVDVVDPGAYASSMTSSSWDSASGTRSYALSFGGVSYAFSPQDNSAASIAAAVNEKFSDKVRAVVVNAGSAASPDYRISLQAVKLGNYTPDLLVDEASKQKQQVAGAEASYIVNGSGVTVHSSSRNITIATGLSVTLKAKDDGSPVSITLTRSTGAVADALATFVTAYNGLVDELDAQHGSDAGALAGATILGDVSDAASAIATYVGSGEGIRCLADLGLELDSAGKMNLNAYKLMAADLTASSEVTAFLGSTAKGGFLKWAADRISVLQDSETGQLAAAEATVGAQIADVASSISDQQARVDEIQKNMEEQMATLDALIASLEQQYTYISGMFTSMRDASSQYA